MSLTRPVKALSNFFAVKNVFKSILNGPKISWPVVAVPDALPKTAFWKLGDLHISQHNLSLKDLTLLSANLTNKTIKFKRISRTSIYDIPYFVTDNKKIRKFYKWSPRKNIDRILKDIFIWLRQNKMILKYFK